MKIFVNAFREIARTKSRFFSIVVIVFLGCGIYTGIKLTPYDMLKTVNQYYEDYHLMDIHYQSTQGFTAEKIEKLKQMDNIDRLSLNYEMDVLINPQESKMAIELISFTNEVNQYKLIVGRFPDSSNECVIENNYKLLDYYEIGSYVTIDSTEQTTLPLKEVTYKVVGIVENVKYTSFSRSYTNIGNGQIASFIAIPEENFLLSAYTDLYICFKKMDHDGYSDTYKNNLKENEKKISALIDDIIANTQEEWYSSNRFDNPGYAYFLEDVNKIASIASAIPVFFIFITVLICVTAMLRMVDENRLEIGTLFALGYSKYSILVKFLLYASLATLLGNILGIIFGVYALPLVLYNAFEMNYLLPALLINIKGSVLLIAVFASFASTILATFLSCSNLLRLKPSLLMRPKSPILGKKIFLEKFGFIWKRLNYNFKMTLRNLFRYKQRLIVTIIGVGGCIALMLTGFGLRNAIVNISDKQFKNIFIYDVNMTFSNSSLNDVQSMLDSDNEVKNYTFVMQDYITINVEQKEVEVNLIVPSNNDDLKQYIVLKERKSKEKLHLNDQGIVINEGLSNKYDIGVNDIISVSYQGLNFEVKVIGITENYTYNYIYMDKTLYEDLFKKDILYNSAFINCEDVDVEHFLQFPGVYTVVSRSSSLNVFQDSVKNISFIILIIIIFATLLGFVVLYNLSSININERKKELATFKVLGLTNLEVTNYIGRENIISVILGFILGIIGGTYFEKYVIKIIETEEVMFIQDIDFLSYVYTFVLLFSFTIIINLFIFREIKKLDLVEAMKAVE